MKRAFGISFLMAVMLLILSGPQYVYSLTIDTQNFSGSQCGADCFGATYTLVVTDASDLDTSTFSATLTVDIGTYTGSMTHIGAVDIKPGNVIAPVVLVAAPGPEADWNTLFTGDPSGQAAGNCLNGQGGFLCSYDIGTNTNAPTDDNTTYTWTWNFSLDANGYTFGHLGVNYTVADDSKNGNDDELQDGENISIGKAGTTNGTPTTDLPTTNGTPTTDTPTVPEPWSLLLLGLGLAGLSRFFGRSRSQQN